METNSQHENLPGTPKDSARGLYSAAAAKSRKRMSGAGPHERADKKEPIAFEIWNHIHNVILTLATF